MFCRVCGKEINDEAVICPHCGCTVKDEPVVSKSASGEKTGKANVMSIVGFVLSLVSLLISLFGTVATAGLVLSKIGLVQCNQRGERMKGLAVAGIIISSISIFFTIVVYAVYGQYLLYILAYYL